MRSMLAVWASLAALLNAVVVGLASYDLAGEGAPLFFNALSTLVFVGTVMTPFLLWQKVRTVEL